MPHLQVRSDFNPDDISSLLPVLSLHCRDTKIVNLNYRARYLSASVSQPLRTLHWGFLVAIQVFVPHGGICPRHTPSPLQPRPLPASLLHTCHRTQLVPFLAFIVIHEYILKALLIQTFFYVLHLRNPQARGLVVSSIPDKKKKFENH